MKLKSVFFYQAVKVGAQMINSAHSDNYDLSFNDNLAFIYCPKQKLCIAVPTTNIPQMTVLSYAPSDTEPKQEPKQVSAAKLDHLAKARAAAAAKREALKEQST